MVSMGNRGTYAGLPCSLAYSYQGRTGVTDVNARAVDLGRSRIFALA
ncbi:hypothetical protein V9K90_25875 [Pseudomonas sp. CCNWLW56]|nr:hypothetical protein [Pseudomonas sp. NFACC36]SFX08163.1 hypothetical protein SAMN03159309_00478 [Pseudomonas sp. NFACC36]